MNPRQTERFPVSLILERRIGRRGPWTYPLWSAVAVVAGEAGAGAPAGRQIRQGADGSEQFIWPGFAVVLYRDGAESYWHNLVGRQPSLFVICRADGKGELAPFAVTADYDEAGAHMEADDTVFAVPIPPEIHRWIEEYVMANYHPTPPVKRQRKRWTEEANDGR